MSKHENTRRRFLKTIGTGAAALALPEVAAPALISPRRRPNIIYFIVHDLGKHLPNYGVPIDAENLERFGSQGVTLDRCFCASAACSPSRGVAMSGLYAHSNGLMGLVNRGWSMPRSVRTVVDELNDAGYETAHFGFQHERNNIEDNRYQVQGDTDRFIENTVDNAIGYLESREKTDRPFYLNVATQEVHASLWGPGGVYNKKLGRGELYGVDPPEKTHVPADFPDNELSRYMLARFQACIRYMDGQFGRFLDAVDRLGLADDTLMVFTTDHGIAGSRSKGTCYERGLEIATMLRLPDVITAGTRVGEPLTNLDFLPMLLDVAGAPVPEAAQGKSFWPRLVGGEYQPHEAVFCERNHHDNYDPMRSVHTSRFHYIRNFDLSIKRHLLPHEILALDDPFRRKTWPNGVLHGKDREKMKGFPDRPREELYDVLKDPHEFVNLAEDPMHADTLTALARACDGWMRQTNDPLVEGSIPDKLFPHEKPLKTS